MKTILVPTDFTQTASNAAMYAFALAKEVGCEKIILYNAYQAPVTIDPAMPVMQLMNIEDLKRNSNEALENFRSQLDAYVPPGVKVEYESEFSTLTSNIDEVCERTGAGLIVMGITGGSKLEEVFIGSTAVSVVHHARLPVIIVPPEATYSSIKNIVLAFNLRKIAETTPMKPVKTILDATNARLYVLDIDHHKKEHTIDAGAEKRLLDKLLHGYEAEYHLADGSDYARAINDFANSHGVDLIITIPKKHGLLEGLFKTDYTKHLAFHTHVPLMCIHEDDVESA